MALTCSFCGTSSDPAGAGTDAGAESTLPLTWSSGVEGGVVRYFCADCTRKNLRAMEGKLDSAWW
ncbi:hypothetical protein ACLM5J_08910 [Nocardioides sp. Bht2]|uniref:hypothetical protein n=1 Tax=Nocardioides sp. Bht2 TaxID=3392297 RepID=UPI0039B3BEEE